MPLTASLKKSRLKRDPESTKREGRCFICSDLTLIYVGAPPYLLLPGRFWVGRFVHVKNTLMLAETSAKITALLLPYTVGTHQRTIVYTRHSLTTYHGEGGIPPA